MNLIQTVLTGFQIQRFYYLEFLEIVLVLFSSLIIRNGITDFPQFFRGCLSISRWTAGLYGVLRLDGEVDFSRCFLLVIIFLVGFWTCFFQQILYNISTQGNKLRNSSKNIYRSTWLKNCKKILNY